jgi:hypothetical protein
VSFLHTYEYGTVKPIGHCKKGEWEEGAQCTNDIAGLSVKSKLEAAQMSFKELWGICTIEQYLAGEEI